MCDFLIKSFMIFSLLPYFTVTGNHLPEPCILKTASMIDGSFVSWKTLVETVHPFMQRLYERVFGVITSDGCCGLYFYHGSYYTLDELADYESQMTEKDFDFLQLFQTIKIELIALGNEFFAGSEKAKPVIVHLIKESCLARNNKNSLLMIWSTAKTGQETILFHDYIKTMNDLRCFCIDLLTFLHDFVHSCPKARQQLHTQLEKWHKVKNLVSLMIEKNNIIFQLDEKGEFLHYLKQNALPRILLDQINSDWIYSHYLAFYANR